MADLVATIAWILLQLLLYRYSADVLERVRRDHGRAAALVVLVGIVCSLLTSGPLIWWLLAFTPLPSPVTPAIVLPFSTAGGLILGILRVGLPLLIARRRQRHSPIALPVTSDSVLAVALDVALTRLARWSVLVPAPLRGAILDTALDRLCAEAGNTADVRQVTRRLIRDLIWTGLRAWGLRAAVGTLGGLGVGVTLAPVIGTLLGHPASPLVTLVAGVAIGLLSR